MKILEEQTMKQFAMLIAVAILFSLPAGAWGTESESPLFEKIDADKTGTISSDEFINAPLGYIKTKDGKMLLLKQFPAKCENDGTGCIPLTAVEKRELFKSLDKDKNNAISRKEWIIFKDGKFLF